MDNSIARFQISADEDFRIQFVFVGLSLAGRTLRILVKERASNVIRTTLTLGAGLTLDGTDTVTALVPQATASAWAKGEFETDLHDITGGTNTRLVGARTLYDLPGKLPFGVIGAKATVQWVVNKAVVTAIGGIGPAGPANTLTIGTVDTLEHGEPATASITGGAPNQVLSLGLPKGDVGDIGPAGTITVGSVTTGVPGSDAAVTNIGTPENAILDFSIPEGDKGDKGDAATIAIGTVTTGAPGAPAAVTNVGTSGAAVFDFTIPKGDKGDPGTATIVDGNKGDITTSDSGDTWTINGGYVPKTGGDFTGPTGVTGAAGTYRAFDFKTGTSLRWRLNADNQAEAGGNAGSDFAIACFDDAGAYIENAFRLGRVDGVMYLPRRPDWGATPWDSVNLDVFTTSVKGLVPAATGGAGTKFLRDDGTWQNAIPPGMTATFAMSSPPAGWLAEDGSAVSVTTYAALDAAIYCGNANNATAAWGYRCTNPANPGGSRSTSGTHIVLRDRRGEFERGLDGGRGVDPSRSLWSWQEGTKHPNMYVDSTSYFLGPKNNPVGQTDGFTGGSVTRTILGGSDNATINTWFYSRPRNVAGLPCIKY